MEYFELSFFFHKDNFKENNFNKLNDLFKKNLLYKENGLVEYFNDEGKDFIQIIINIFELVITKDNFKDVIKNISAFVSNVFEQIADIFFATGIYELTYYLIENVNKLCEFDDDLFQKFPIIFLRPISNYNYGRIIFYDNNLLCFYNEKAQNLF